MLSMSKYDDVRMHGMLMKGKRENLNGPLTYRSRINALKGK
jgi:hypothetical protein